jgi:flagellar motor switch protein FliG
MVAAQRTAGTQQSERTAADQRLQAGAVRRVAILINHLDAENRRKLLTHFTPDEASRLRTAAASLIDVDPLEVRRVVTSFVGRITVAQRELDSQREQAMQRGVPGSRQASLGTTSEGLANEGGANTNGIRTPQLQFLGGVSDITLLQAIETEHPQTVAVVLASLAPEQAARLLKRLPESLRNEAIRRLGRLDEIPVDVLEDIGRHLKTIIGTLEPIINGTGRKTLTSIFAAMGDDERSTVGTSLAQSDNLVAAALQAVEGERRQQSQAALSSELVTGEISETASGQPGTSLPRLAVIRDADATEEGSNVGDMPALPATQWDTVAVDHWLENLPPRQLQSGLATLETRTAFLALCGLTPTCVKRVLRTLPRRQAKEIEQRLGQLGTVELADIEAAKYRLAVVTRKDDVGEVARPNVRTRLPFPAFWKRAA